MARWGLPSRLRNVETYILVVSFTSMCAIIYLFARELHEVSERLASKLSFGYRHHLAAGRLDGMPQRDVSDFEWQFWCTMWPVVIALCMVHSVLVKLVEAVAPRHICPLIVLAWDVSTLGFLYGPYLPLLLFGVHLAIHLLLGLCNGSVLASRCVRVVLLGCLIALQYVKPDNVAVSYLSPATIGSFSFTTAFASRHSIYYGAIVLLILCTLREFDSVACIQQSRASWREFLTTLGYLFYVPVLYSGPFISYSAYRSRFLPGPERDAIPIGNKRSLTWLSIRVVLAFCAVEVLLHYFYLWAMRSHVESIGAATLFALLIAQSFLFTLKYVALYGMAAVFTECDGIRSAVQLPWSHFLWQPSALWREFDVGLYTFLTAHVYRPLAPSRSKARRLLALVATFLFVHVFHGMTASVGAWSVINFIEVVMERIITHYVNRFCAYFGIGRALQMLISAVFRSFLFVMVAAGLFFFFDDYNAGLHFMHSFVNDTYCIVRSCLFFVSVIAYAESWRWFRHGAVEKRRN